MKIYTQEQIQKVYQQFAKDSASVVYSDNGGYSWQTPPMDTGKWRLGLIPYGDSAVKSWVFAFLK